MSSYLERAPTYRTVDAHPPPHYRERAWRPLPPVPGPSTRLYPNPPPRPQAPALSKGHTLPPVVENAEPPAFAEERRVESPESDWFSRGLQPMQRPSRIRRLLTRLRRRLFSRYSRD